MKNINNPIGCCGSDCKKCAAVIAARTDDNALHEKTSTIGQSSTGCRMDGAKTPFCRKLCFAYDCVQAQSLV